MSGIILLIVGFGFVIFIHELGHFIAAKWVGIRVEQFALGFGQALLSYRKGMGLHAGSSGKRYAALEKAAREGNTSIDLSRYGETEYRFNWMPLGGYVKMLGQDDLNPNARSADPRSYNSKSIGARMIVVSAGVIMNIIFGTLGFMILFRMGLSNPPAVVGAVQSYSPAQETLTTDGKLAPLQVGDRILEINGRPQYDFTKVRLAIALAKGGEPLSLLVQRADGRREELRATPQHDPVGGLLYIGFTPPVLLRAPALASQRDIDRYNELPPSVRPLWPGESIVAANGQALQETDFVRFHQIIEASDGRPVTLSLRGAAGAIRKVDIHPQFAGTGEHGFEVAGMQPRAVIASLLSKSAASGKLAIGDVVLSIRFAETLRTNPTIDEVRAMVFAAGAEGKPIDLTVLRGNAVVEVKDIVPNIRLEQGYGLGIGMDVEEDRPVVAGAKQGSPAARIIPGSLLRRVAEQEVRSWRDVVRVLRQQKPGTVHLEAESSSLEGTPKDTYELPLTEADLRSLDKLQYSAGIELAPMEELRKTTSPLTAARWGLEETRDFAQQFYVGLQRMFEGTVSTKNMMGPVGMVQAGAFFADKGLTHVLWFLAMISANLALVNFLPIPIVDGGLFLFLIIEKIQGKPLSARAQNVAQYVGLAILLSVFLFATYQDILRFLTVH